jgi:LemA protein
MPTPIAVTLLLLLLGLAAALWLVATYNALVRRRNGVENAFASVDVAAKKRYDLVPNLVGCVRAYVAHERGLLEEVVRLRNRAGREDLPPSERLQNSDRMSAMLSRMMMLVEGYPDLRADAQFLHLQRTLTELEEQLSAARRFFNTAVTQYNDAVEAFPTNLLAPRLGFGSRDPFRIDAAERSVPAADLSPGTGADALGGLAGPLPAPAPERRT